jgi:hypothetical protein
MNSIDTEIQQLQARIENKIKCIDDFQKINHHIIPSYSLILSGIYNEKAIADLFLNEKKYPKF